MAYDFDNATVVTCSKQDVVREMMAAIQSLDVLARAMERKWGASRLPALVSDELCQRFYRQLVKLRAASHEHRDEDTIVEAGRMVTAWRYLDQEAERLGAEPIHPAVWETTLSDGTVIALVRDEDEAAAVDPAERNVKVFLLSEIARLIEAMPTLCAVKDHFPGAKVVPTRTAPPDAFWERGDEIPF